VRIIRTAVIPPTNGVDDVLGVRAEVTVKLVTKLRGLRRGESSHVVEVVVALRRARRLVYYTYKSIKWDEKRE
jgi:hypothetical protein